MGDISTWKPIDANNDQNPPDGWPENQKPSTVNNCARADKGAVRRWYEDPEWINYGFAVGALATNKFEVSAATSTAVAWYNTGRRVRFKDGANTYYGTVSEASVSGTKTNVTATMDSSSASLSSSLSIVDVGLLRGTPNSVPTGVGGGFILLATASASSSSSVDFDNYLDSTYDDYLLIFSKVVPQTSGAFLWVRIGTGATPTYQSGASDYAYAEEAFTAAGGNAGTNSTGDSKIIVGSNVGQGTVSGQSMNGQIFIHAPADTSANTVIDFLADHYRSSDNVQVKFNGAGWYNSTTAVTSLRFLFSTGNIASGEFKLYGLVKS